MTVADTLRRARDIIADESRWTPACPVYRSNQHCMVTALAWASENMGTDYQDAYRVLRKTAGRSLPEFNSAHTHAEVLAVFDRAIEAAA